MNSQIKKLNQYLETVSLGTKLPVAIFSISLFIGLLMASLVHIKLNNLNRKNIEHHWHRQLPALKQLLHHSLENEKDLKAVKQLIADFEKKDHLFELAIWNSDFRLITHNDVDIAALIKEQHKDPDIRIKDLAILTAEARNLSAKLFKEKSSYIPEFSDKFSKVFFAVKLAHDYFYVLLKTEPLARRSNIILILINYLVALILSFVVAAMAFYLSKEFSKPTATLLQSLRRFKDSGRFLSSEVKTRDETGQNLREIFQILEGALVTDTRLDPPAPASASAAIEAAPMLEPNANVNNTLSVIEARAAQEQELINYLQEALYDKPLQRYKNVEVTLYPKKAHSGSTSFFSSAASGGFQDFMFAHFDETSVKANLMKHRMQEKFYDLSSDEHSPEDMGHKLWLSFNNKKEYSPGLLYIRTTTNNAKTSILRAGSFSLYSLKEGEANPYECGESYFTSGYQGVEEIEVSQTETFLIVTGDFLEALGLNSNEFYIRILSSLNWQGSGKNYIGQVLNKIYSELDALDPQLKLPGSLATILWK